MGCFISFTLAYSFDSESLDIVSLKTLEKLTTMNAEKMKPKQPSNLPLGFKNVTYKRSNSKEICKRIKATVHPDT
jgi:hypothetical protein